MRFLRDGVAFEAHDQVAMDVPVAGLSFCLGDAKVAPLRE